MNSNANYARDGGGYAEPVDEELEYGEPISDVETPEPAAPKIAALRGPFSGNLQPRLAEREPSSAPSEPRRGGVVGGQMVLASAKYLQRRPEDPVVREANERRQQKEQAQATEGKSLEGSVFNSGVLGGTAAMMVAIVWFLAGLVNEIIFFYPPILFVIGLGAFFKGLMRGK
jgi:hypothetical protein